MTLIPPKTNGLLDERPPIVYGAEILDQFQKLLDAAMCQALEEKLLAATREEAYCWLEKGKQADLMACVRIPIGDESDQGLKWKVDLKDAIIWSLYLEDKSVHPEEADEAKAVATSLRTLADEIDRLADDGKAVWLKEHAE